MPARLSAFLIWAAAAAGVVFWALRLGTTPIVAPPGPTVALDAGPRADLSRLLGAPLLQAAGPVPPPMAESTRFRLLGVIAEGRAASAGAASRVGVALLTVDGKPPRAYRVGASIDGNLALQSVTRRGVAIGPPGAPASVTLELPPLPAPATGEPLRLRPDGSVAGGQPSTGPAPMVLPPNVPSPGMPPPVPVLSAPPAGMPPPPGMAPPATQ